MEQHVKRRVRVKPPPHPAGFRDCNQYSPGLKRFFGGRQGNASSGAPDRLPGAGSRTELIQNIKQCPARLSRARIKKSLKKKEKPREKGRPLVARPSLSWEPVAQTLFGPGGVFPLGRPVPLSRSPAEFPAPDSPKADSALKFWVKKINLPLPALAAALLTLVVSIAAINWKAPAAASLGPGYLSGDLEEETARNLASYAGLYPQSSGGGEAIPLDLMETFSWKEYRVRKGDTLSEIAKNQQLSLGTLIASNGVTNARRLREGEILRVPNMNGIPYTVKAGDSLSSISASSSVPLRVILDVNNLESDVINPGMTLFLPGATMPQEDIRLALGESFIYPVRAILSSPYGWRIDPIAKVERFHSGIDLAAPQGTPVRATIDGKVSRVAVNSVYGRYIILTHPGGYQSLYAHLSAASVKPGDKVAQGAKIGEVGSTGYSTGPHLHFSVFKNNKPVNPLEVLQR
jgi:murein DD-endopeptidase MepM/ murein hydrolase activator NlpD